MSDRQGDRAHAESVWNVAGDLTFPRPPGRVADWQSAWPSQSSR